MKQFFFMKSIIYKKIFFCFRVSLHNILLFASIVAKSFQFFNDLRNNSIRKVRKVHFAIYKIFFLGIISIPKDQVESSN